MTQKIGLEAVFEDKDFQSGVARYNRSIDDMVSRTMGGASSMGSQFASLGTSVLGVAGLLGGALVAGAGAAAVAMTSFVADGVQKAMAFESQLDGIQAVLGATGDEIGQLGDLIIDLGLNPNLKVDAVQAADAIDMLARNGLSATEILNGAAEATVLLANATGADFATSANIATDAMAIFNIKAEDMTEAVNGITSVTVGSKFDMNDYALALAQAGGVASSAGVEFVDFNTSIAAISPLFASGSDAGTSFKTMLQRLIPSTDKAEDLMRDLGIITDETGNAFFDSEGNMKSMNEIAIILNDTMANMSEEQRLSTMSTLFGTDAMRAAVGMMDSGAVAYTDAAVAAAALGVSVDEVNQFIDGGITKYEALMIQMGQTDALESAATRMDNVAGAMEILGGIVDSVKLQVGNVFLPLIRQIVDEVTAFLSENQDAIIGFFTGIADGITEFVTSVSEGQSPIQAFFDALAAGGVDEDTIAEIEGIVTAVQDFIDKIVVFVSEHSEAFKGAFVGIGAVLAGSVIVAIISGIIAALTALATPVTAIIAAAALLGAAWSENWFGIRDTVTEAWTELQPTFQTIKEWLETNIPVAIEAVTTAFGNISDWFADNKQTILDFIDSVITPVKEAWEDTGTTIGDMMGDQFAKVGDWFAENKPLIQEFATVLGTVLAAAVLGLIKVWSILQVQLARFVQLVSVPILESLVDHFLNVATLIMQIVTGDWAGAWESVKTIVSDSVENLLSVLGGFVDFIAGWFGSSGAEIASIWSGIWDNISAIVSMVWDNITTAISTAWESIVSWFTTAGETLSSGWTAFWDGLFLTISAVWESIVSWFQGVITSFTEGWAAFWDGLFLTVSTVWTAITTFITDAIASFVAAWDAFWLGIKTTVDLIWESIKTFLMDTLNGILEGMGTSLEELKTRWGTIWTDVQLIVQTVWDLIVAWITEKVVAVQTVITEITTAIQAWWDMVWAAISLTVTTIWETITTWINTKITEIQTIITTIVTAIQAWWDATWTAISTTVTTIWDTIATWINTKITEVQTIITTVVTAIQTWWQTTWDTIKTTVTDIWTDITEDVDTKVNEVKTTIEDIINEVKTWWDETWTEIADGIKNTWDEIHTSIEEKLNDIKTLIEEKINDAKTWLADQVTAFKTVGADLILGIKNGILENAGAVLEAITGVIEDAIGWAKTLLGIASPSRVFAEMGAFSIEGLIAGITAMEPELASTMSGMVDVMLAFGQKLGNFGSGMAARFKRETLDPMKENMDGLEKAVTDKEKAREKFQADWAKSLGMSRDELMANFPRLSLEAVISGDKTFLANMDAMNSMTQEINGNQEQLNAAAAAYAQEQERILQLEKQRQDMQFLQQQLDLLKTIRDAGLDPADILGGMQLGLEASVPDLMAAMSNAMQAIVDAANQELQIASPSKVFKRVGDNILLGLAAGLKRTTPVFDAIANVSNAMVGKMTKMLSKAADVALPTVSQAMRPAFPTSPPLQGARPAMPAPVVNVDAAAPQYNATFNTRQSPLTLNKAFRLMELSRA